MKKIAYKAAAGVAAVALLLSMLATGVFAAEAVNEDTGYLSDNFAVAADGSLIFVDNINFAGVGNFSMVAATSGFNWAASPGGDNEVLSGSADASTDTDTTVNDNFTAVAVSGDCTWVLDHWFCIPPLFPGDGTLAGNYRTGRESLNVAVALDADLIFVDNFNLAGIDNFSMAIANSGFNAATGSGGGNSVDTGDATASTATDTFANASTTCIAMGDSGGVSAINEDTGYLSDNFAVALALDVASVDNINVAGVENTSVAVANSGVNYAGGAGGDNEIDTGAADASTTTTTEVNDSATCIGMDGHDDASAENSDTGRESLNVAVAADVDVASVDNVNVAGVENTSVAVANSGANAATGPGGENSVDTGDAEASTDTSTTANTNVTIIGGE